MQSALPLAYSLVQNKRKLALAQEVTPTHFRSIWFRSREESKMQLILNQS